MNQGDGTGRAPVFDSKRIFTVSNTFRQGMQAASLDGVKVMPTKLRKLGMGVVR